MPQKIQIDGVGTVEVDDNFMSLPPDQQQKTVEEIAAHSAHSAAPATAPSAPAQAPTPTGKPTYRPLERALAAQFPGLKFTSDYRDPQHNRSVGGVEGSLHTMNGGDAVDMVGGDADTPEGRERIRKFLADKGITPKEFLYHNAGSGNHLHIGALGLPDDFLAQYGDHPAPNPTAAPGAPPSPDRDADIAAAQGEAAKLLAAGKEKEAIALLAQHQIQLAPGELDAFHQGKRAKGFSFNKTAADAKGNDQSTPLFYWDQTRRGLYDLLDAPANIADLVFKGGEALGRMAHGGPVMGENKDLPLPDIARPGTILNEMGDDAEQKRLGYVTAPQNALERYTGAGVRMAASAAVPAAKLAAAGKARAALAALTGATTGGATGEAGADVAPILGVDPDKARLVGQVLGSVAGGVPLAAKPIADARFVAKRLNDPRTPFAAKAVEKMDQLAQASKPNGVFPKGRGPLSVEQINSVGKEFLNEVEPRLSGMNLGDVDAARFRAAIKRRADLKPDEIAALEGTPTGDAIAEGIRFFQTTRTLTPGYNGYKPGPIRRALELGLSVAGAAKFGPVGAVLGPIVRRAVRGDPADLNMSRLDAGKNALKRKDAWAKLGAATGADSVGSKTAAFIQEHDNTVTAQQEADAAAKQTKADAQATRDAAAGERRDQQLFKQTFPSRPKTAPDPQPYRPSPTVSKATSALKKLEEKAQVGSTAKAIDKLNAPPKPTPEPKPKARPAQDLAAENNMAQGIHGNYNAYADTLGVKRSDVLAALRQIKTDDIDPFEIRKLEHGYKLSPAGRTALIPRLQKQLKDSGVTDFRAKEAANPSEKAPQISDKAKAAQPAATNYDQEAQAPAASPSDAIRPVIRPRDYERGANRYIGAANREIDAIHADPDIPNGIKDDVAHAASRVRDEFKTKDAAYRFIDEDVLPDFEIDKTDPRVISRIRDRLRRVADQGKKHETQEDYDHALKRGPRGRPRKPEPTDDVPF